MQDYVSQTLFAGHESNGPGGVEGAVKADGRPVEYLRGSALWVVELDHALDAARLIFVVGSVGDFYAGIPQLTSHLAQGWLVGYLPADELEIVLAGGLDDKSVAVLIHPQRQVAVCIDPVALQT